MKKRTFAILGLGIFGSSIAQELYQRNFEVIAIDTDIVKVDINWNGTEMQTILMC